MHSIWPESGELSEDGIRAAYAQPDGVRANFVASIDGAATLAGRSGTLGNAADQHLLMVMRQECDVVLVGAGTVRGEQYNLVKPRMAIATRALDVDPEQFADAIIVTVETAPADKRAAFRDVLICGTDEVDPHAMLAQLAERGLRKILCEGGPHLLRSLQAAGAVDELCLTLSPVLAGPGAGRITAGAPVAPQRMRLAHVLTDGELLFTRYARDEASATTSTE
jgi:riboflavin biosynthesis pyrimidine reductase